MAPPTRPQHDLTDDDCRVIAENQGGILMLLIPRERVVQIGLADMLTIRDGMGGTTRYYVTARAPSAPIAGGTRHPNLGALYCRFAGLDRDRRYMTPPPPPTFAERVWAAIVGLFSRK